MDAGDYSPARVEEVITVGASSFNDTMSYWSNFGGSVKILAPGENIISTWINGGTQVLSGTSMAAPFVAGAAAYFFGRTNDMTRDGVVTIIEDTAVVDVLGGIREFYSSCCTLHSWF